MSQPVVVRQMTEADWKQVGSDLYGDDVAKWEFACPSCKLILSGERMAEYKHKTKGNWQPYAECIGRYVAGIGCDWAAYGLFCGPREIVNEDGSHRAHVFYFAKEVATK